MNAADGPNLPDVEASMISIRRRAARGLRKDDVFETVRTFTEADMQRFADITNDYNPVHFDDRFAQAKNFEKRICHGLLVGGMITEIGGQIGWLASGMQFHFRKPVYFGDTIKCRLRITAVDADGRARAEGRLINQHGTVVIEATLTGIIPGSAERGVLEAMLSENDPTNRCTR
jgi:acyl dehydratase